MLGFTVIESSSESHHRKTFPSDKRKYSIFHMFYSATLRVTQRECETEKGSLAKWIRFQGTWIFYQCEDFLSLFLRITSYKMQFFQFHFSLASISPFCFFFYSISPSCLFANFQLFFFDATTHIYRRSCPSVRWPVCRLVYRLLKTWQDFNKWASST